MCTLLLPASPVRILAARPYIFGWGSKKYHTIVKWVTSLVNGSIWQATSCCFIPLHQILLSCNTCVQCAKTSFRCVINSTVLFVVCCCRLSSSLFSVSASNAEVASSSNNTLPGRSNARATAMRCACPSLSPPPISLHTESIFIGKSNTKSAHAIRRASCSSLSEASGLPNNKLSRIEPLKSVLPCGTYTILSLVSGEHMVSCSLLNKVIFPLVGVTNPRIKRISVVFPAPVSPNIAVLLPGSNTGKSRGAPICFHLDRKSKHFLHRCLECLPSEWHRLPFPWA